MVELNPTQTKPNPTNPDINPLPMSPFGVARSIFDAALLVMSLFFAIRLLFAHDMRREAWRSFVKRHVYINQKNFKRLSIGLGWLLLFVAIYFAYLQVDKLVAKG